LDGEPGASDIHWGGGVANPPLVAEKAEDVEDVVTVVGQGEGMDDGVEADRQYGAGDEETEYEDAREKCAALEE